MQPRSGCPTPSCSREAAAKRVVSAAKRLLPVPVLGFVTRIGFLAFFNILDLAPIICQFGAHNSNTHRSMSLYCNTLLSVKYPDITPEHHTAAPPTFSLVRESTAAAGIALHTPHCGVLPFLYNVLMSSLLRSFDGGTHTHVSPGTNSSTRG